MLNRFKFRVWDKSEKIMHINDFVVTSTGYIAKLNEVYDIEYDNEIDEEKQIKSENQFIIDNSDSDFEKDKILMQCTGLKDKNGTLIYEGDILKGKKNMICSLHSSKMVDKVGIVEIPINMFVARCWDVKNNCTLFCQNDWNKTEVIGNIYENEELLEVKNG